MVQFTARFLFRTLTPAADYRGFHTQRLRA
jgi:hypothetical protein